MRTIGHIMSTLKILTHCCLQCFSSKNVLIKHKEDCLSINKMQSVDIEEGIIKFESYSKQLSVPFKIYADFECNLQDTEIYEGSCTKKNVMIMFLVVMLLKLFALIIDLVNQLLFTEVKMLLMKAILKEYKYCKKVMKKYFNKNLIMSEEKEHLFQQSNSCWICKKIIKDDNEKVRSLSHY